MIRLLLVFIALMVMIAISAVIALIHALLPLALITGLVLVGLHVRKSYSSQHHAATHQVIRGHVENERDRETIA